LNGTRIARRCFPDIEAVYVNAGLDFPEVRRFAEDIPNVTVLKPKMRFDEVIRTYGWCYPSKDVARTLRYAQKGSDWALKRLQGLNIDGTPSWFRQTRYQKWAFLLNSGYLISDICCEITKEKPLNDYAKQSGKYPIIGTMAAESRRRMESWLRRGCNAFDKKYPSSQPISIFTEQDVLMYLRRYNIPYASVYGNIVADKKGRLSTTCSLREMKSSASASDSDNPGSKLQFSKEEKQVVKLEKKADKYGKKLDKAKDKLPTKKVKKKQLVFDEDKKKNVSLVLVFLWLTIVCC